MLKKLIEKVKAYCKRKNTKIIGIDLGEAGGDHTAIIKVSTKQAMEEITRGIREIGENAAEAAEALSDLGKEVSEIMKEKERKNRESTNNWRKMHGLPMRRKKSGKKKENKK